MDLCETLFVLQKGRIRIYKATPESREFTIAVVESGAVFGETVLTGQRFRSAYAQAMEKSEVSAFQVQRQCQLAMIALQDTEEASANSDGKLFWYAIQYLLVAVGRISRLLWPPDPLFPKRTEELRESLGVGEEGPFKALTFVEHFEHFGKRLETWYVTSEQRRFFDSYTEPLDVLAETAPVDRFRGYETDKNAIPFQGEACELGPVSRTVEELQQRTEAEMQKPRIDQEA